MERPLPKHYSGDEYMLVSINEENGNFRPSFNLVEVDEQRKTYCGESVGAW